MMQFMIRLSFCAAACFMFVLLWQRQISLPSFAQNSPPRASSKTPELVLQTGHTQRVDAVAFSPKDAIIATASADNTVKLWDSTTGRELRTLVGHANNVKAVAFSPDGQMLASGSLDRTVRIWNVVSGQTMRALAGKSAPLAPIACVAFSADGQLVAAGTNDGAVEIWEAATGNERAAAKAHTGQVASIAFSPDHSILVTGGADGAVKIWRTAQMNAPAFDSKAHSERVNAAVFSADGKFFATGGADGAVNLWNAATPSKTKTLSSNDGKSSEISALAFSADGGKIFAARADHSLAAWDVAAGVQIKLNSTGGRALADANEANAASSLPIIAAAFSADAQMVASSTGDKTVEVRDCLSGKTAFVLASRVSGVFSARFSDDGRMFASGSRGNTAHVWETATGREIAALTEPGMGYVQAVAFRPHEKGTDADGEFLATGGADGKIRIWEVLSATKTRAVEAHPDGINALAFSRDGKLLASGGADGKIKIWDAQTWRETKTLDAHKGEVTSIAFNSNGQLLVSASADKTLKVWDANAGRDVLTLAGHEKAVYAAAFSPDDAQIASGGADGKVKIWDAKTGREIKTLEGHADWVNSVAFSPDGKTLISGGNDRSVRAWDVEQGKMRFVSTGHADKIDTVSFDMSDARGRRYISASEDGSLRIWSSETGNLLATLVSFNDSNDWLVVAPDGLFDGSPAAWNQLLWRFEQNTLNVAPVEAFFYDYYYPGLLTDILGGKYPRAPRMIVERDRRLPRLKFSIASDGDTVKERNVTIKIEVREAPGDDAHPSGSGVRDVRLFRNGSLVRVWRGSVLPRNSSVTVLQASVPVIAGENRFTAYAFNNDNIKSRDEEASVTGDAGLQRRGTLYVLAVGINKYANPQFNLRYAVNDATSFGETVRQAQGKLNSYARVETLAIYDDKATKANIMRALARLTGRDASGSNNDKTIDFSRFKRAEPEDGVIIYYAGHGTRHENQFYLIPHDLGYMGKRDEIDDAGAQAIYAHGISDRELAQVFEQLDVAETLLVLDACNSGQAIEVQDRRQGPMNAHGLAQLAYEKGMYILTAAESFQAAQEAVRLGHGLLTYSLVEEGLKQGKADDAPRDGRVLVREWFDYATMRVPQIARQSEELKKIQAASVQQQGRGLGLGLEGVVQRPRAFYRRELERRPLIIAQP
jgi:WD40 repeat protein/uncharacterized caspase-like protein